MMLRKSGFMVVVLILSVWLVVAQDEGGDGIGDSYYPQLGNSGYDVQHYTIDLAVDMETASIEAVTTIDALATQDLSQFNLDFSELTIMDVSVDGIVASYDLVGSELVIVPPDALADGDLFQVIVTYAGIPNNSIPRDFYSVSDFREGWYFYGDGVLVAGEPFSAATWFPVNDHPLDKATYTFAITVDNAFVAGANGILKDEVDNGDGTTTFVFEMNQPMASYLATIGIGDFEILTDVSGNGIPIRHYIDRSLSTSVLDGLDDVPEMIDFFETVFGPYPFETYGVIVHDYGLPFALETQTLSVFGRGTDEIILAHELAHEWFGNSLSLSDWRDIWLNEGFATYAEALWLEYSRGRGAYSSYIAEFYGYDDFLEPIPIGDPSPPFLFAGAVYIRGALTLASLRATIGDEAFFTLLLTYVERFQNSNVTTADFIALAEEISGQELDQFFEDWLTSTNAPY